MAVNTGRLVMGGLAAGIVANALEFLWAMMLRTEYEATAQRLGLDPAVASNVAPWIMVNFVFGILLVITYAGFRARWGPGPKTAIYAGLVIYLAATIVVYGFYSMGIFTRDMFMKGAALSLVTMTVSSVVGAWVYKEA